MLNRRFQNISPDTITRLNDLEIRKIKQQINLSIKPLTSGKTTYRPKIRCIKHVFATNGAQTKDYKKRLFDKFFDNFAPDLRKSWRKY